MNALLIMVSVTSSLAADPAEPRQTTPQLRSFSPNWVSEQKFLLTLPDPATATLKSALIGFGAGHMYACQSQAGAAHALAQVAAIAGIAGTAAWAGEEPIKFTNKGGPVLMGTAIGALVITRLIDVASAPASARASSKAILDGAPSCLR